MRVALFQAYLGRQEKLIFPLGLTCLASVLHEAGDVELFSRDLNTVESCHDTLRDDLRTFSPELIGISLRNIDTTQSRDLFYYYQSFREQIQIIKEVLPDVPLVVGGAGFSLYAERIMKDNPQLDFGVYREGEETLLELIRNTHEPGRVAGLYYRNNGEVIFSSPRKAIDLATVPVLKWDAFDLEPYRSVPGAIGVETKRGCGLRCEYCTYPFLDGNKVRRMPTESILHNLQELRENHGITNFTFVDSIFNIPQQHARNLCEQILEKKVSLHWVGWFNEKAVDREFIRLCQESGCIEFSYSPDAFSDQALHGLGKNISRRDILQTYETSRSMPGVNVSYNFVANPPGQSLWSFISLFLFLIRTKVQLRDRLKGFCITNLRIEPNTGLHLRALREHIIEDDTDLLPDERVDLRKLFYSNPETRYLNFLMHLYVLVWSARKWLKERF